MGLTEIQHAIEALPAEQQASLAVWLSERDRHRWDLELEQDFSPGGAGMALLDRVKAQVDRGESKPMAEGRRQR
jgi:hypothetical protein